MFCALTNIGINAIIIKNNFFIIISFYRLPPALLTPPLTLPPPLLTPAPPLLELLLGLLILVPELLLGLELLLLTLVEDLLLELLELGLTYSELDRTCLLLLAGVYDLRSEEDEGLFVEILPLDEGLLGLFCADETLSFADTRGDAGVILPLEEGLLVVLGRALLPLEEGLLAVLGRALLPLLGLAVLEGLLALLGTTPADDGRLVLPAICNPPTPLGLGPLGCGLTPGPGYGG